MCFDYRLITFLLGPTLKPSVSFLKQSTGSNVLFSDRRRPKRSSKVILSVSSRVQLVSNTFVTVMTFGGLLTETSLWFVWTLTLLMQDTSDRSFFKSMLTTSSIRSQLVKEEACSESERFLADNQFKSHSAFADTASARRSKSEMDRQKIILTLTPIHPRQRHIGPIGDTPKEIQPR